MPNAENRLVLFPGSVGDFVCLLPTLEVIRCTAPDQKIDLAVRGDVLELAECLSFVSSVVSLERAFFSQLFSSSFVPTQETVQFFSARQEIFSWFGHARPEMKAALDTLALGRARSFAFFSGQDDCHASGYYLCCVGVREARCPSWMIGTAERQWAMTYIKTRGWKTSTRILLIQPGSGGTKKRWAAEGFAQVARWWRGRKNSEVLILLGPAEENEVDLWQELGVVEIQLPLRRVTALLNQADCYIGNDSGISHLAGAVGARGVVLFGPTLPQQWRPLGGSLAVLRNAAYRSVFPDGAGISLAEISPEEVIATLQRHRY